MNWADKARKRVNNTVFMFFRPKHLSRFEYGAQWQRDQLRGIDASWHASSDVRVKDIARWADVQPEFVVKIVVDALLKEGE